MAQERTAILEEGREPRPNPIGLQAGEPAPDTGAFYPGREAELLRDQLKYRRDRIRKLSQQLAFAAQEIQVLEQTLELVRRQVRAAEAQAELERRLCPGLLERNTGLLLGATAVVDSGGDVHGGLGVTAGIRLGRWRR